MSTNLIELGPFEHRLTVAVDGATLESAKNRAARRLSRDLKIKGFRPGKAPRSIVENTVGSERIKEEAIDEVLPDVVGAALDEAELEPAVTPSVDAIRDTEGGVEVDVRVTLWPSVEGIPAYDGRRVEVDAPVPTDDDVAEQLDRLRNQFAELETVEREADTGDYVAINLNASQNGKPMDDLSAADLLYEVGSATYMDGLDGVLVGRSAGAIEQFSTTVPEMFGPELTGAAVEARVLVKEVKRKVLPELTDEWVDDFTEFDTVEDLRTELQSRMETMALGATQQDFQSKLMFELLEELEVDTPEAIITGEMDAIFHRFVHQLGDSEIEFADYLQLSGQSQDEFLADLRAQATHSVKTDLLLDGVAADADLEISDDEMTQAYEALSSQVDETAEQLAIRLAGTVQEKRIASDILRRRALETLVRGAVAVDSDGEVVDLKLDLPQTESSITNTIPEETSPEETSPEVNNPEKTKPDEAGAEDGGALDQGPDDPAEASTESEETSE